MPQSCRTEVLARGSENHPYFTAMESPTIVFLNCKWVSGDYAWSWWTRHGSSKWIPATERASERAACPSRCLVHICAPQVHISSLMYFASIPQRSTISYYNEHQHKLLFVRKGNLATLNFASRFHPLSNYLPTPYLITYRPLFFKAEQTNTCTCLTNT